MEEHTRWLEDSIYNTYVKKGKRNDCCNCRGILVTSTFSKIYRRIIKGILEEDYRDALSEEQVGFRVGQSTIDNVYCIMQYTLSIA
jgi:hypothetical protein